jgi:hypothetical protein
VSDQTDELHHRLYEEAIRDAFEEGKAIVAEAVARAEARRRFHTDSEGCTVVSYVDAGETPAGRSTT